MSTVLNILKKHDKKSAAILPSDSQQLPPGSYVGVITKGEVFVPKGGETDSVFARFQVKVTEGELTGSSGSIGQNIIKSDGSLNEVGVSIVKGILKPVLGAEKATKLMLSEFEAALPKAVGFIVKWRVTENGENTNQKVLAVLPPSQEEGHGSEEPIHPPQAEEPEAEEPEEGEAETEEDDMDKVKNHLAKLDRTGLKNFIKQNTLEIQVMKSWSDDKIREEIVKATNE